MYDTYDHCSEGGIGGTFVWYQLNYCIETTDENGAPSSVAFTACGDGLYTQTIYSDNTCSEFEMSITAKLQSCQGDDDDDDDDDDDGDNFDISNYQTYMCSA
jgi:hypothetical protein